MKSNAIIRIVLFSIVILVLLSILGVGIAAGILAADLDAMFSKNEGTVSSTGTADADVVRKLSIEWVAGTITIRPADVSELTLTEIDAKENDPMVWLQSGETLKISYVEKSFFHFGTTPSKDLLIEVPRDWSCAELEVEAAAADLDVEGLTIGKVDFDGASGVCRLSNCTVDTIDLDTASGDIYFTGTLNTLDCDAASADCEIILDNVPNRIEMDMASGDLDLTLPEECGFTASLEALSGDFESDFTATLINGNYVYGDGSCRIDVSAMSGDVYIHKAND